MMLFEKGAMLLLYAESMTHVGAAESATIDLAIQRNPLTRWPEFQSSGLKGSLRAAAPRGGKDDFADRTTVFGYDEKDRARGEDDVDTKSQAGLLAVGDASLLAFPVASLAGIFGWITCPQAIRDFQRSYKLLPGVPDEAEPAAAPVAAANGNGAAAGGAAAPAGGPAAPAPFVDPFTWAAVPTPATVAVCYHAPDCRLFTSTTPNRIELQDMLLTSTEDTGLTAFAEWLALHAQPGPARLRDKLKRDLVLVHDDMFAMLVEAGIHIVTRVKIDDESGTVGNGPWDEELLPAETILYAPLQARFLGKGSTNVTNADQVRDYVGKTIFARSRRFQIGAGATIGRGIMAGAVLNV